MLRHRNMNAVKTWSRFHIKNRGSPDIVMCIMDLTKDIYDDYIEFHVNNFAKRETTHHMAGIPYNVKSLNEYKTYLSNIYANTPFYSTVCFPEVEGKVVPKILATNTLKLHHKNKLLPKDDNIMAKTSEVRKFFQIDRELYNLCPIHEIMEKYGVEYAIDYIGTTVHPNYAKLGIATEIITMGSKVCEALDVKLSVGWVTSEGTQKACDRNGWITEYEINTKEFAKKCNVTLENLPPLLLPPVLKFMTRKM